MKFLYEYRTPDNAKHSGVICASDREAAYAALKKKGIKPSRFAEAPGFFNKLFGKGKRWMAIAILAGIVIASVAYAVRVKGDADRVLLDARTFVKRSQIYGDPATLQMYEVSAWASVFSNSLERILAAYAVPGRGVDPNRVRSLASGIREPLDLSLVKIEAKDCAELAQMKRMVNWMKRELSDYLAAGGKFADYVRRLHERQLEELRVRNRIVTELAALNRESPDFLKQWEEKNDILRTMGILPVAMEE